MKSIKIEGKTIYYPFPKKEFQTQFDEIVRGECYKEGRRKEKAVYLDIGANIGLVSLYFKNWAKMIYAIEPSSEIYKALVKNTKEYNNIKTFNLAITPVSGKYYLYAEEESKIPQTFFPSTKPKIKEKVTGQRLDEFMDENEITHIDVMKVDVEGAEYIIFPTQSFGNVADRIDFIIGESHYNANGFPELIPLMLKDWGFKTQFLDLSKNYPMGGNYLKFWHYYDKKTKEKKDYVVGFNTMFVAYK